MPRGSALLRQRLLDLQKPKQNGSKQKHRCATTQIPTLSLFSGAGGLDIGFAQAGFDIKACVEIEPSYCETLKANLGRGGIFHSDTRVHCGDVRTFDARQYHALGIRCVIGGPPCQTFSAAGRRSGGVIGIEDERGQLFQAYCRILSELKPEVFVFENVYGLPGANGGKPWRAIVDAFSALGYKLRAEVVDAADYGVPQHRERLVLVGFRNGTFIFPMPTHGPDSDVSVSLVSVEEAIRDLQTPNEPFHNNLGGLYGHLLPLVPEGLNYAYFTAEMGHPEPVFAWRSKFHDLLYKVNRAEPCRTIKAQPGKFTGPFHWKNRHFTMAELKRLQTFPDEYELIGSFAKVVEQIGNSVPPRLAHVIAASVRDQLIAPVATQQFDVRPPGFRSTFRQRQRLRTQRFTEIANASIKAQFAKRSKEKAAAFDDSSEFYYMNPINLFDRTRVKLRRQLSDIHPRFSVRIAESGSHIQIKLKKLADREIAAASRIRITGLRKYLIGYDSLSLDATIDSASDIFHAWAVIEEALTRRSRFFTLIDIYGHYANRGDTVKVSCKWKTPKRTAILDAINYFGSSAACGDFVEELKLLEELSLTEKLLPAVIADMRSIRFDIRTIRTHPIIGEGRVICTYPFPLLSPRALVESRAKLVSPVELDEQPAAYRAAS